MGSIWWGNDEMQTCANCGKQFDVLNTHIWAYKTVTYPNQRTFYCSWKCMREKELTMKITLEQKKKAVDIAIAGGDPIEHLRKCGSDAPDQLWYYIKNKLKVSKPELYAKIPDRRKNDGRVATVEELQNEDPVKNEDTHTASNKETVVFEGKEYEKASQDPATEDQAQEAQKEEQKQETKEAAEPDDDIKITAVSTSFGVFDVDNEGYVTWEDGHICYQAEEWRKFIEILPRVLNLMKL